MEDYQQRVVDEKDELDQKLDRLSVFMKGDTFKGLPSEEQSRMDRQLKAMSAYSEILAERIAAF